MKEIIWKIDTKFNFHPHHHPTIYEIQPLRIKVIFRIKLIFEAFLDFILLFMTLSVSPSSCLRLWDSQVFCSSRCPCDPGVSKPVPCEQGSQTHTAGVGECQSDLHEPFVCFLKGSHSTVHLPFWPHKENVHKTLTAWNWKYTNYSPA